jgi:HSP20 family protein
MTTTRARWWAVALPPVDWDDLSWVPFLRPGIRIEERRTRDTYVVRAELPGLDPARDVYVTCHHGLLRLHVRRDRQPDTTRSEFRYGSSVRTITLPPGAREDEITASYTDGILEVRVPVVPRPVVTEVTIVEAD